MTSQGIYRHRFDGQKKLNRTVTRAVGTIMFVGAMLALAITRVGAGASDFTFGAVGDSGAAASAQSVFKAIGSTANTDPSFRFVQHVGDYSYAQLASPGPSGTTAGTNAWCQLLKDQINVGAGLSTGSSLGENFPIMLATGNHEATLSQPNPSVYGSSATSPYHNDMIEDLKTCLPNQFASQTTASPYVEGGASNSNYAREYYYDYPAASPIARFIVTSPGSAYNMTQTDGNGLYDYSIGSDHYNWLAASIDAARSSGIKWVIVTNHTNYISAGSTDVHHNADIPSDYFNLLLSKRVDLILQGHNHIYQRSKQLANNVTGCTTVSANTYDADCVASDGGTTNAFTKGQGSILAIVGMGGDDLHSINTSDGDYNYFDSNMGLGTNDTFGFLKVNVTDTKITADFVRGTGQPTGFNDTFTIEGPADTTAPTVTLTSPAAGATLTGTTTLTATAADDTAVTKVEFYEGTTKLGEDLTSPYAFDWNTTTAANGSYTLKAIAYDAAGNSTPSSTVTVTVNNVVADPKTTVNLAETTSSEPAAISEAVMTAKAGTCNDFSSAKTVSGTGITVPESGVSILGGFDFTLDCTAVSGSATVDITLGELYADTSKLRIYKEKDTVITDVTSQVNVHNTDQATVITYTLLDGAAFDSDSTANSTIKDPLYVGVLGANEETASEDSENGTSEDLEDTGTKVALYVSGAFLLFATSTIVFSRTHRRYKLSR
jgi:hypothetical protein